MKFIGSQSLEKTEMEVLEIGIKPLRSTFVDVLQMMILDSWQYRVVGRPSNKLAYLREIYTLK